MLDINFYFTKHHKTSYLSSVKHSCYDLYRNIESINLDLKQKSQLILMGQDCLLVI